MMEATRGYTFSRILKFLYSPPPSSQPRTFLPPVLLPEILGVLGLEGASKLEALCRPTQQITLLVTNGSPARTQPNNNVDLSLPDKGK